MVTWTPFRRVLLVTARPEFGELPRETTVPGNKVAMGDPDSCRPGWPEPGMKIACLTATLWQGMCYIGCGRDGG